MSLSSRQQTYLKLMGIDVWLVRNPDVQSIWSETKAVDQEFSTSKKDPFDWVSFEKKVLSCTKCSLHKERTQAVFGVGSKTADWMFIGEAPGAEEDKQGRPFVGRAGKLLDSMLHAIGLEREHVYIANIIKCRPSNNRDPLIEEISSCKGYLHQQIVNVKPKIIVALGRVVAQALLRTDTTIGKMRGNIYEYSDLGIPLVATYHPAYLLRSPREKQKTWQDLQVALKLYDEIRK